MKKKAVTPSQNEDFSEQNAPLERKFSVCIFKDKVTLKPRKRLDLTWPEFIELCQSRELRPNKHGRMLGTYALKSNGDRRNVNILHHSMTLIDIDTEGIKDSETGRVLEVTRAAPSFGEIQKGIPTLEWVATSTHWHEPSRGVNKFRFALVPDRNIDPLEHEPVLEALDEMLGGILDRSAWGLSQAFFLPSCPRENEKEALFFHNKGVPFCVDELVRRGKEIISERQATTRNSLVATSRSSMPETPESVEYVTSLLKSTPADVDRAKWRNILWSVASLKWSCGKMLAREWSETSSEKYDAEEFDRVWASYDPSHEKKITLGTLVHIAREYGFTGERPKVVFTGLDGDVFNGRKFAEMYRGKLLHVHDTDLWLQFDPQQGWVLAPPREEERAAKEVVKALRDELAQKLKEDN